MQQADVHYVRTVYDNQQRLSQEHELSSTSAAVLRNADARSRGPASGHSRDLQGIRGGGGGPAGKSREISFSNTSVRFFDCSWWRLLPW